MISVPTKCEERTLAFPSEGWALGGSSSELSITGRRNIAALSSLAGAVNLVNKGVVNLSY